MRSLDLLSNSSHVLCVSAGAGHAVEALQDSGVIDVTGVDLIDYPPLVKRADPHNLPFFDDVFDLGFSDGLAGALYPIRFVTELERTVRRGGAVVLVVARKEAKVEEVVGLFKKSNLLEVRSVNLDGSDMNLIIMKNNGTKSS
jgi:SAM-dependent methyltransferase